MTKRRDWFRAVRWVAGWSAMAVGVWFLASPLGGLVLCGAVLLGIGVTLLVAPVFAACPPPGSVGVPAATPPAGGDPISFSAPDASTVEPRPRAGLSPVPGPGHPHRDAS